MVSRMVNLLERCRTIEKLGAAFKRIYAKALKCLSFVFSGSG
jgi:hypothetical protein